MASQHLHLFTRVTGRLCRPQILAAAVSRVSSTTTTTSFLSTSTSSLVNRSHSSSFSTTSSSSSSSVAETADQSTLNLLLSYSKWSKHETTGKLHKTYEFKDARTAARFVAQTSDALLKAKIATMPITTTTTTVAEAEASSVPLFKLIHYNEKDAEKNKIVHFVADLTSSGAAGSSSKSSTSPNSTSVSQKELSVALVVDNIAAELQLAGRWN